jgi:acetyl-CoA C-acetyltransferase
MPDAVIAAVARSPIGRAGKGSLRTIRPDDLAAQVVRAALNDVPEIHPGEIDDLYLGAWEHSGGQSENVARRVAVQLGFDSMPGATINRACASSVQAIRMAANAIKAGDGKAFVAGGVECVSQYPSMTAVGTGDERFHNPLFDEAQARTARIAAGHEQWTDPRQIGLVPDIYVAMGQTAENVAAAQAISRAEQDEFAVRSQNRAERAISAGVFDREILPVKLPDGSTVAADDGPRPGVTIDRLAALVPVFREGGTVTAGNCCSLNDGAAATIVMSDEFAASVGVRALARIVAFGVSGLSPEIMGLGPIEATRRALARAGMSISDIDLVEMNEAFAAQVIPCARELAIDEERLNVHGGAIALGHPFGMTGARMVATLLNGLQARDGHIGLVTMCVGGGQGMAMILERLS